MTLVLVHLIDRALKALHFSGKFARMTGTDVRLEHQGDAAPVLGHCLSSAFDHVHHLIPLTLDLGEHGTGGVRQAGIAHDLDGFGHRGVNRAVPVFGDVLMRAAGPAGRCN